MPVEGGGGISTWTAGWSSGSALSMSNGTGGNARVPVSVLRNQALKCRKQKPFLLQNYLIVSKHSCMALSGWCCLLLFQVDVLKPLDANFSESKPLSQLWNHHSPLLSFRLTFFLQAPCLCMLLQIWIFLQHFHIICFIEIWLYTGTKVISQCDKMLMWSNVTEIKCHCDYLSVWSNVYDKLSHKNMSWPHFSKPQVWFILHPECCTSAKVTVPNVFEKYFSCMQRPCSCQKKLNSFCYVCGEVVLKSQRKPLSKQLRKVYEPYFGGKIRDKDKFWAPRICCSSFSRPLAGGGWKKWRVCLLKRTFPKTSEAKLQEGIFVGPQIKQIFEHQAFSTK